jgi:prepilin-type N-terminal cleavage/methylation domain-containing protein
MNTTSRAAERQRVKRYRLHAKPHGFTLIELLVVIAIISILAAILFPVFASALERGRMTNCISNARQIGMGMMQYVQDYDEFFPGACMEEPTSVAPSYPGDRVGYEIQIMPYVKSDGIFTCLDDAAYRVPPAKMLYSGKSMFYDPSYITKALKRSYVYIGQINTNQAAASEPDTNTGVTTYATTGGLGKKETIIDAPS